MITVAPPTTKELEKGIHESSTADNCWKLLKDTYMYTLLTELLTRQTLQDWFCNIFNR